MARKTVLVSDLGGEEIKDGEAQPLRLPMPTRGAASCGSMQPPTK